MTSSKQVKGKAKITTVQLLMGVVRAQEERARQQAGFKPFLRAKSICKSGPSHYNSRH